MASKRRVPGREGSRVAGDAAPGGGVRVLAPKPAGAVTAEGPAAPRRRRHLTGAAVVIVGLAAIVLFGGGDQRTPAPVSTIAPVEGAPTAAPKGPAVAEAGVPEGLDLGSQVDVRWNASGDQLAFIDDPDGVGALTMGPPHDLSVVAFGVRSLAWHPTDSRLAFVAEDFSGVAERWLFVIVAGRDLRTDGLVERQIALEGGEIALGAWGDWGYVLEADHDGRPALVVLSLDGGSRGAAVPLRESHGAPKALRFSWP